MVEKSSLIINQAKGQLIFFVSPQALLHFRVLIITAPAFLVTLCLACVEGIVAYTYFDTTGCDPLDSGKIWDPNQVHQFQHKHTNILLF